MGCAAFGLVRNDPGNIEENGKCAKWLQEMARKRTQKIEKKRNFPLDNLAQIRYNTFNNKNAKKPIRKE